MLKNALITEWGLNTHETARADALWGARATVDSDGISFYQINQDWKGTKSCKAPLRGFLLLNLDKIREVVIDLIRQGKIANNKENEVTLFDNETFKVIADTKGSYSYLYLTAFLKEDVK